MPPGEVVVVGSGTLWTAVQPLELTDLGGGAPIRLVELDGHLALEMYNYTGPAKTFWEMAKPGSFYQGQPRCGFYAELAERTDYASGANFAAQVASGTLVDEAAPPATYTAGGERTLRVEYARDDRILGIEVDLYEWSLKRRWTQDGPLDWPMHESPTPARALPDRSPSAVPRSPATRARYGSAPAREARGMLPPTAESR